MNNHKCSPNCLCLIVGCLRSRMSRVRLSRIIPRIVNKYIILIKIAINRNINRNRWIISIRER